MTNLARLFENFENVDTPKECKTTGVVPSWLTGTMVRNGPGQFSFGDTEYRHWFDGMAYIQRYQIKDGKMWYSAKFLDSDDYKANKAANRIVKSAFGTIKYPDLCKNIFHRYFSYFMDEDKTGDNCGVAFSQIGDAVYALTEVPRMIRIDMDTIQKIDEANMSDYLSLHTYTAHHQSDEQGNIFNIGTRFGKKCNYVFGKTENPLNVEGIPSHSIEKTTLVGELASTDPTKPAYFHSFAMSENYIALLESPLRINIMKLVLQKVTGNSYRDSFVWDDSLGVNVLIMDKKTGKKLDFKVHAPPFFTFHHANSFEKDGFLVMDYCKMRNTGDLDDLSMSSMKSGAFQTNNPGLEPFLHRMIVPLSVPSSAKNGDDLLKGCAFRGDCKATLGEKGTVEVEDMRLCEESLEFPRYNYENFNMKDYKYVYGTNLFYGSDLTAGIVKSNVVDRTHLAWHTDNVSQFCAEPIFVLQPDAVEEDDGILIVPVMTTVDGENPFVVILDAKEMKEVARFTIPESRIPMGFHAMFQHREGI